MGVRGPVQKRSDERLGHRSAAEVGEITRAPGLPVVEVPESDPAWHVIARDWFDSLACSGQSAFYQASDWATARYLAEAMSRNLSNDKFSAVLFASVMSGMSELLTTEGSRRRLRLELQRAVTDVDEDAAEVAVNVYRANFGA